MSKILMSKPKLAAYVDSINVDIFWYKIKIYLFDVFMTLGGDESTLGKPCPCVWEYSAPPCYYLDV